MIDWTRVNELQNEIGTEDFGEVVELFLEEADDVIDGFADLPEEDVGAALHFLKGMALNLGFAEMARLCQKGETSSQTLSRQLLVSTYADSKQAFAAGLVRKVA